MILIFDIVNFPFLDGDFPQCPSYGEYISQLIRFDRASSHVTDFNNRNKFLTAQLLKQGYRYHKLRKAFSKFYRRHFELIEKYHVSLKKNLCNKVILFVIQNSIEIWYINLRKSLEIAYAKSKKPVFSQRCSTESRRTIGKLQMKSMSPNENVPCFLNFVFFASFNACSHRNTLIQSYKRTPNIFTLVQNVNIS